jgi:hypothetical protein
LKLLGVFTAHVEYLEGVAAVVSYISIAALDVDGAWATSSHRADNGWVGWVRYIDNLEGATVIVSYISIVALDIDRFWGAASSHCADNGWTGWVRYIDDL